jgi:hypothetical protein
LGADHCVVTSLYYTRLLEARQQSFFIERLLQKADRAALACFLVQVLLRASSNHNDWRAVGVGVEPSLEINSTQSRHMYVGDDAAGRVASAGLQKLVHRPVGFDVQTEQAHEARKSQPHRFVVVDDGDHRCGHGSHLSGGEIEGFSHLYEIGERARAHLTHRRTTMNLNRNLAETQLVSDLFVHLSGGDKRHHFALAG